MRTALWPLARRRALGVASGAAGTTALNVATTLDMTVLSARPASCRRTMSRLATQTGVDRGAGALAHQDERLRRSVSARARRHST